MVDAHKSMKKINTILAGHQNRHDTLVLKRSQLDMRPWGGRNKTASDMPGKRDVYFGIKGLKKITHPHAPTDEFKQYLPQFSVLLSSVVRS